MKYIDKKYGLGQTKDICDKKQKGGDDEKTVIYYYKKDCEFCTKFDSKWRDLCDKKNWDCQKIEYSDSINPEHKKQFTSVPAIFVDNDLTDTTKLDDM